MTYFINKSFTKRNYEATNLVYAEMTNGGTLNTDADWQDCGEHLPARIANLPRCEMLYMQAGVRYYGYL